MNKLIPVLVMQCIIIFGAVSIMSLFGFNYHYTYRTYGFFSTVGPLAILIAIPSLPLWAAYKRRSKSSVTSSSPAVLGVAFCIALALFLAIFLLLGSRH